MVHLPSSPVGEGAKVQLRAHLLMSRHAHGRAHVPGRHGQRRHLLELVRVPLAPSNRFVNETADIIFPPEADALTCLVSLIGSS